jgi:hypothetical protein
MTYVLSSEGITLKVALGALTKTKFPDGAHMEMQIDYDTAACYNHLNKPVIYDLTVYKAIPVYFCSTLYFCKGTQNFTLQLRNPFESQWAFNGTYHPGVHKLFLLQTMPINGEATSPAAESTLGTSDTVFRTVELFPGTVNPAPVVFSEQPNGYSRTISMFFDELPGLLTWSYMTTDTCYTPLYDYFFLKLLMKNERRKMGYLVLYDMMVNRNMSITSFCFWNHNSMNIYADTLEHSEGKSCAVIPANDLQPYYLKQDVSCKPNAAYTLRYSIKTKNVNGYGSFAAVYSGDSLLSADGPVTGTTAWQDRAVTFKTRCADTVITIYLKTDKATGTAFFDNTNLVQEYTTNNILYNSGFEEYDAGFMYDTLRRHWSDAHGPMHLASRAPASYLDYLRRLDRHTRMYGWEDRVALGCHGYHHSPSLFEPDPMEEFHYYDTIGDQLRINRIFSDAKKIGLSKNALKFWRSPGFNYTKSLIDLLVDSNFIYFDVPPRPYDTYFAAFDLYRNSNHMWGVVNSWWADYDNYSGQSTTILDTFLSQGHIASFGGHPYLIFNQSKIESYNRFDSILSGYENKYPSLGYVFPSEYAENANALCKLKIVSVQRVGVTVSLNIKGTIRENSTLVYFGTCSGALLNNSPIPVSFHDSASYLVLPASSQTDNVVVINNVKNFVCHGISAIYSSPNIPPQLVENRPATLECYNLKGQKIAALSQSAPYSLSFDHMKKQLLLASGMYIFKSISPNNHITTKIVSVKR